MILIIITPDTLYRIMKHPKFNVICDYLLNQSVIQLYAPSQVYKELEKKYKLYGSQRLLRKALPPTMKEKQLMEELKKVIKLVPVAEGNEKYKKYKKMAPYVELCEKIHAFGIWDDLLFQVKFDVTVDYIITEDVPYLPTTEIMQFLGREMDFLMKGK